MAWFRKSDRQDEAAEEAVAAEPTHDGPWDSGELPGPGERIDVGALWLPKRPGINVRLDVDKRTGIPTTATLTHSGSMMQLQVFAAPRSQGIWDDIRAELAATVMKQGGTSEDLPGPFGRELLARLPAPGPDGKPTLKPARFLGVDGPRWFLRAVITGKAAGDPVAARELEDALRQTAVARGVEAKVPRELLPLVVPGGTPAPAAPPPGLEMLARGPEITETR